MQYFEILYYFLRESRHERLDRIAQELEELGVIIPESKIDEKIIEEIKKDNLNTDRELKERFIN